MTGGAGTIAFTVAGINSPILEQKNPPQHWQGTASC